MKNPRSAIRVPSGRPQSNSLRALPSVDRLLSHPTISALREQLPHSIIAAASRAEIDATRDALLNGDTPDAALDALAERAANRAWGHVTPSLRPVINATGVIIQTNLGRAP